MASYPLKIVSPTRDARLSLTTCSHAPLTKVDLLIITKYFACLFPGEGSGHICSLHTKILIFLPPILVSLKSISLWKIVQWQNGSLSLNFWAQIKYKGTTKQREGGYVHLHALFFWMWQTNLVTLIYNSRRRYSSPHLKIKKPLIQWQKGSRSTPVSLLLKDVWKGCI